MSSSLPRRRVPRGTLSREVIVRAALLVLDRDGIDGLTTRAVARELGADPTALYRHFADKTDLLRALGDLLLAEVRGPAPRSGWRAALERAAIDFARVLEDHPGAPGLFARIPYSLTSADLLEQLLAHLIAQGLPPALAAHAVRSLVTLVFGHVVQRSPLAADGFWAPLPTTATPTDRYPALSATTPAWTEPPGRQLRGDVALLLDGVATRAHAM